MRAFSGRPRARPQNLRSHACGRATQAFCIATDNWTAKSSQIQYCGIVLYYVLNDVRYVRPVGCAEIDTDTHTAPVVAKWIKGQLELCRVTEENLAVCTSDNT